MKTIEERQDYFKRMASKGSQTPYWPEIDRAFQVIITANNEEEHILECLESVEIAMRNEKWVMHFGDDGSTDKTLSIVNNLSFGLDPVARLTLELTAVFLILRFVDLVAGVVVDLLVEPLVEPLL